MAIIDIQSHSCALIWYFLDSIRLGFCWVYTQRIFMFFQFVCIEIGWSGCDLCTRNCFHSSHSHHIFRYCFSSRLLSFAIHIAARHSRAYLKKSSHRQCRDEFSSISIQSNVPITRSELAFDLWTWYILTMVEYAGFIAICVVLCSLRIQMNLWLALDL